MTMICASHCFTTCGDKVVKHWFYYLKHEICLDIGVLEVLSVDAETGVATNISRIEGDQGNEWHELLIEAPQTYRLSTVQLRGYVTPTAYYGKSTDKDYNFMVLLKGTLHWMMYG